MKISPHVSIYKFPLGALSSITNRLTGLSLSGIFVLGGLIQFCPIPWERHYESLSLIQKKTLHYTVLFPTLYHTFGGIRHFIWDKYPHLMTNKVAQRSSIFLILGSSVSTFVSESILSKKKIK